MRRRADLGGFTNVWPAFTDVLAGLLMVLILLITIFVVSEVLLTREMASRDTAIGQMSNITEYLEKLLGDAGDRSARLEARVDNLEQEVAQRDAVLARVRAELAAAESTRRHLEASLEERLAVLSATEAERTAVQERLVAREQAYETLAETRERELSALEAQAALVSARAERLAAELERLNRALEGTREELTVSQARVGEQAQALAAADLQLRTQQTRLEEMDQLIKRRLLDRVEELEAYASEFYGRLRTVFADNPDIKVEGDRFVFQSEVLFPSGEASLSLPGQAGLDKFVEVYRQVADRLPPDMPVIIEVQGHTDRVPIRTAQFPSNWELSVARALGVVNYFISRGIPPERLAAKGMGEYHPIDPGGSPESLRRNRRIELKITSR